MSGIVGFVRGQMSEDACVAALRAMRTAIHHCDSYVVNDLFVDRGVCGTRTHNNIIQREPQPYQESGLYVWLDGEFYNQDELPRSIEHSITTDPQLLLRLFRKSNQNLQFLREIDGIYSSVIYDSNEGKVYLISDRYGLRYLYWTVYRGGLAWASEVKAILALPGFEPKIDRIALNQFIQIGYMLEDRTWIEGINMLASGTVLTFDITMQSLQNKRYWWWN